MQKIEWFILTLAVISFVAAPTGERCGALQYMVKDKSGKIGCQDCIPCGAGLETTPPCDLDPVYDEDYLHKTCQPCKDRYYKEVTKSEKENTKKCHPCNTCGNHVVVSPCNKTHGEICGDSCKDGHVKNDLGICILSSTSEPDVMTRSSSASAEPTQKPTTTNREESTKKTATGSHQSLFSQSTGGTLITTQSNERATQRSWSFNDSSNNPWKIATIVLGILCGVLIPLLCYACWKIWKENKKWKRARETLGSEGQPLLNSLAASTSAQQPTDTVDRAEGLADSTPGGNGLHTNVSNQATTSLVDVGRGQQPNNNVNQPANSTPGESGRQANGSNQATTSFIDPAGNEDAGEALGSEGQPLLNSLAASTSAQQPTDTVDRAEGLAEMPIELGEDSCCCCEKKAGKMLHDVPRIGEKMSSLSTHLKDEEAACNKLFNYLNNTSHQNNRIKTTEDLYDKLYAAIPNLTLAKFFRAFKKTDFGGVLDKIHDDFHSDQ